jgi:hypothetical protein
MFSIDGRVRHLHATADDGFACLLRYQHLPLRPVCGTTIETSPVLRLRSVCHLLIRYPTVAHGGHDALSKLDQPAGKK